MVKKMLANQLLAGQDRPPHVIVDASQIKNQTLERFNTNILADQLRSALLNAAQGRLIFVNREAFDRIDKERQLKSDGIVGQGTTPAAKRQLGADYQLFARLTDLEQRDGGRVERYTQFNFEMVDLETGQTIFSDMYNFKKRQSIPVVYR